MQQLLERIDGVMRCLGAEVRVVAPDYTTMNLTDLKTQLATWRRRADDPKNAAIRETCLGKVITINTEIVKRMELVAGMGAAAAGGAGHDGGAAARGDDRSGSDESVGKAGPVGGKRTVKDGRVRKGEEPKKAAVADPLTALYNEIYDACVAVPVDAVAIHPANNNTHEWQNNLYLATLTAHAYEQQLSLAQMRVLLKELGPKIAERVVVYGISALCRCAIYNNTNGKLIAYAFAKRGVAYDDGRDDAMFVTFNAFLHTLDSVEEKAEMYRVGFRGDVAIEDIRHLLVDTLLKFINVPATRSEALRVAFRNYYFRIGGAVYPTADESVVLLNAIATAVGDIQIAEDVFFTGVAVLLRNVISCMQNMRNPNTDNERRMRNAGLDKAMDMYLVHVAKGAKPLKEYVAGLNNDKDLVNAVMHATDYKDQGFFSCFKDQRMLGPGVFDEGRYRKRYGILRWGILRRLFLFVVEPMGVAAGGAWLNATMEGLGGSADNYVSVRELIERMALGPSALYE